MKEGIAFTMPLFQILLYFLLIISVLLPPVWTEGGSPPSRPWKKSSQKSTSGGLN
jgi:hypothetical protein